MSIDFLLKLAGEYERTHQLVLHVLFEHGLSEQVDLPPAVKVGWEFEKQLFDLALNHEGNEITAVEIKTWSSVSAEQARRQRSWAAPKGRRLLYVLMGHSEYEGVPDAPLIQEQRLGVRELRAAVVALSAKTTSSEVRDLAEAYARWLEIHDTLRRSDLDADDWTRAQYAFVYDQLRRAHGRPASIYVVNSRSGDRHILNFTDSWKDLHDPRVGGAQFFWELHDGRPYFKFGPVPKDARKSSGRVVREELRSLVMDSAAKHGVPMERHGRTGEHMSIGRVPVHLRTFLRNGALEMPGALELLDRCWAIHGDVIQRWEKEP